MRAVIFAYACLIHVVWCGKNPLESYALLALDAACVHHTGQIRVHVCETDASASALVSSQLAPLRREGCDIAIVRHEDVLKEVLAATASTAACAVRASTPAQVRAAFAKFSDPPIRYAHHADFLRWLVPYQEGGFYMDLDHILLKPVATIRNLFAVPVEHVGFPDYGYELVDGKVIWAVDKVYV